MFGVRGQQVVAQDGLNDTIFSQPRLAQTELPTLSYTKEMK